MNTTLMIQDVMVSPRLRLTLMRSAPVSPTVVAMTLMIQNQSRDLRNLVQQVTWTRSIAEMSDGVSAFDRRSKGRLPIRGTEGSAARASPVET